VRPWRLLAAFGLRTASVLFALVLLTGSQALAADDIPSPHGGESPLPRGLSLGAYFGWVLTDDRATVEIDGGGAETIEEIMRSSAEYEEWVEDVLGGPFEVVGEPQDFTLGPQFTFGLALGYSFLPRWEAQVGIASYRDEARATVPMVVETDGGTESLDGVLVTEVHGLIVDAIARKRWRTGVYIPQLGAGVRLHRLSPGDTWFGVESVSFFVNREGPRNDFSPMVELGLGRALGEKFSVGVASEIAGRSLPEEDGGESWVIEPEFRLWARFLLAPDR
jgi:hypothetical protein